MKIAPFTKTYGGNPRIAFNSLSTCSSLSANLSACGIPPPLLYHSLMADGSDIAACGVEMVSEDGTPLQKLTRPGSCVLNSREAMEAVIRESWLKQPVWYKLYKAALIRDIPFPVGKYHEDVFWSYRAVALAQKVSVFDTPCYFYIQRSGSIMGEEYSPKRLDSLEAKGKRLEYIKKYYPLLSDRSAVDLLFSCIYNGQLSMKMLDRDDRKQAFRILDRIIKQCSISTGEKKKLRRTHQLWIWLSMMSLPLTCRLRNRLGIGL